MAPLVAIDEGQELAAVWRDARQERLPGADNM